MMQLHYLYTKKLLRLVQQKAWHIKLTFKKNLIYIHEHLVLTSMKTYHTFITCIYWLVFRKTVTV